MIASLFRYGFILVTIFVAGCAALSTGGKAHKFQDTVHSYNSLIKWGDFQTAQKYTINKGPRRDYIDMKGMKNVRVVSFDVKHTEMSSNKMEANIVVEFQYANDYSPSVRKLIDRQKWVYSSEGRVWRMHGTLPNFNAMR